MQYCLQLNLSVCDGYVIGYCIRETEFCCFRSIFPLLMLCCTIDYFRAATND